MTHPAPYPLFPELEVEQGSHIRRQQRAGTFTDNMKLPVHRWFRYSAGFSAEWVEQEIGQRISATVFDPFSGSGTSLIAAERQGVAAIGQESHPFVSRVAQAKLFWRSDPEQLRALTAAIIEVADQREPARVFPSLLTDCYDTQALYKLESLRLALLEFQNDSPAWQLCWLAYVGIIRATSHAGTAQWQYVLPNKRKSAPKEVNRAFTLKVEQLLEDMATMTVVLP